MSRSAKHGATDTCLDAPAGTSVKVPQVSVVITTYNRAAVLPRAVESVLAQTYTNFELIVVDDHSTDSTPEFVASLADERVRSLRHDCNTGQSKALNTGIDAARGEYVAFLDDDDEWLPQKLASQVAVLDAAPPQVALVYGWRRIMDEESSRTLRTICHTWRGDIFENMLALDTPVPPSLWLIRMSVAQALCGFNEKTHRSRDVEFICRLCEQGWHVDYVPRVVLLTYLHWRGQMVDKTPENFALRAAFIRQHLAKFDVDLQERPATRARVHFLLARFEFPYHPLKGTMSVANACVADPAKWKTKIGRYSRSLYYMLLDAMRTSVGHRNPVKGQRVTTQAKLY